MPFQSGRWLLGGLVASSRRWISALICGILYLPAGKRGLVSRGATVWAVDERAIGARAVGYRVIGFGIYQRQLKAFLGIEAQRWRD